MLSAAGSRGGGPLAGGQDRNVTTNSTRAFECYQGGERHGAMLISLASAGVIANLSLAGLVIARRSLRRFVLNDFTSFTTARLLFPTHYNIFYRYNYA